MKLNWFFAFDSLTDRLASPERPRDIITVCENSNANLLFFIRKYTKICIL